ncbi:MAG: cytochrome d ubiquinol oxidase subunit II [Muribaculaceae bacterium]|nr:cytochrome d ubiquinol oxidase subunit II [Muribaculaceae bacterium]
MDTLVCLQQYWWLLIAVLGAALVFLLFVQGGQSMLLCGNFTDTDRALMINVLGKKWELGFTTLVVFGGAFFASFPLFYSTSFGGAYWLWMLILFSFILQAVSYEFRSKPGNLFGTRTYDVFLFINGCVGCILLGEAVAMMFFGGDFTVTKTNLLDGTAPVISQWGPTHGLEAIVCWKNLLTGVMILMLARTLAALYMLWGVSHDEAFHRKMRRQLLFNAAVFVVFFLIFLVVLLTAEGVQVMADGTMEWVANKYLYNFLDMPVVAILFLIGVVLVLWGIAAPLLRKGYRYGFWWSGAGSAIVVVSLFCIAGFNGTAYYPSTADAGSSLTLANSSSSLFTLTVMSWVSVLVPFVLAYIAYVWYKMSGKPVTPHEIEDGTSTY